jgi:hypothetical protein
MEATDMSSYIPAEDAAALTWMNQFSSGIAASPYTYLLSPADATAISSAVSGFADALAISDNENTRTKITIAAKDDARASAEQMCRAAKIAWMCGDLQCSAFMARKCCLNVSKTWGFLRSNLNPGFGFDFAG